METIRIDGKRYHTITQTACITGISREALYRRIKRKRLEALKIGRYFFIETKIVKQLSIEKLKGDLR
jgi:hypothetical protein